jgi:hypothetical protein
MLDDYYNFGNDYLYINYEYLNNFDYNCRSDDYDYSGSNYDDYDSCVVFNLASFVRIFAIWSLSV